MDSAPKNAKDLIFTEENVNNWFMFSHQMSIQDLTESIRSHIDSSYTRSDARDYMECYGGAYENFLYNYSIRRFIECCFVAAFRQPISITNEWLTPHDISAAISKYNIRFDYGEQFEKRVIEDKCELLLLSGSIEKHPDDEPNTENTRYRIKY